MRIVCSGGVPTGFAAGSLFCLVLVLSSHPSGYASAHAAAVPEHNLGLLARHRGGLCRPSKQLQVWCGAYAAALPLHHLLLLHFSSHAYSPSRMACLTLKC